MMAFQGVSTTMASGVSTLIAMPLDTIKTGLQVLDGDKNGKQGSTVGQTMKNLVKEDRWMAYYEPPPIIQRF